MLLELEKVTYAYEKSLRYVLRDITIGFEAGKVYCIVGKSGSGKSTLLSLLSGLDVCKDGTILYDGVDLKKLDRDVYRSKDIGVIFQSYNLLNNATVIDNILLSMSISGSHQKDRKEYAYHLLEQVGINRESANRKVLKLSGGEQQRVAIARAIAHNPKIIIADEPSGNLDEETEQEVMQILLKLAHDEGKCVIIVTHSLKLSRKGDEIWSMNKNGTLLFVGEK